MSFSYLFCCCKQGKESASLNGHAASSSCPAASSNGLVNSSSSTHVLATSVICCPQTDTADAGVPTQYKSLKKATNNFNSLRILGEGDYGTFFHGVLQDGREVAVKRLHVLESAQLDQYMKGIEVLAGMHHENIVCFYETSRSSRWLFLVYEYVSNGSLTDHLYKIRSETDHDNFTWPVRMKIAIHIATALSHLHSSGIVHSAVKSRSILLDADFNAKLAGLGLSRNLPESGTHFTTAAKGISCFVDPDYLHYQQLSDKSDVYSFGGIIIEMISCIRPDELQKCEIPELIEAKIMEGQDFSKWVDPSLGFDSDGNIKHTVTSTAKLALRCLQRDKERRPTMAKVLQSLQEIQLEGQAGS